MEQKNKIPLYLILDFQTIQTLEPGGFVQLDFIL